MSAYQAKQALMTALMEITEVSQAHDDKRLELENANFKRPSSGEGAGKWYSASFMPNPSEAIECGSAGDDECVGVFQVLANTPLNQGDQPANTMLLPLVNKFRLGTHFQYEGQDVMVLSAGPGPGYTTEHAYVIPFSVFFQARWPRNNPNNQ